MNRKTIIRHNRPAGYSRIPSFSELWSYRYMVMQLILRDFKTRYTQSVLGVLWVVIAPIVTMIVFTFVFNRLAEVPSYDVPYPIFNFAALVPWQFFVRTLGQGSNSIVSNKQLVTDVYVPRLIIPFVTVISATLDLAISFLVLLLLMLMFGILPAVTSPLLLFFLVQLVLLSIGLVLMLSALQVRFRDINPLVGFAIPLLVFLSPVAYPTNIVDGGLRVIYALNPMVGILDGWRWALLGIDSFHGPTITASVVTTFIIFGIGFTVFTRSEATFADWI